MAAIPKRFAVFKAGYASGYTETKYGGYAEMLANLFKDPGDVWDIYAVIDGKFPSQKELDGYDGFVITGSSADAHGNNEWILKLCDVINYLFDRHKKVLGICFGHQVLSRALGGNTGRASVGWELGLKEIHLNNDLLHRFYGMELPPVLKAIESHQDQVSCVPPNGIVLGYSAQTDIEIFAVGNTVLGIQCHPEFSEDVLLDILKARLAQKIINEEVANEAMLSFKDRQPDQEILKNFCKLFLKRQ
jgi:GMP synthase-like glutamine amidotransferase